MSEFNWKEYIPEQPVTKKDNGDLCVFYLQPWLEPGGISVERGFVTNHPTYTDQEMNDIAKAALLSFDVKDIANNFDIERLKVKVATATRRGMANTNWNNVWYYKGSTNFDSPFIVGKMDEDKYVLFVHPNFDMYGFVARDIVV